MKGSPLWREVSFVVQFSGNKCVQRQASRRMIHFCKKQTQNSKHLYIVSYYFIPIIVFFKLLSLTPHPTVPSVILSAVIQVNEVSDIATWQPPTEPNGVILYYNIRISRDNKMGREQLVQVVQGVMGKKYDFSTLELGAGTYVVQVSSLFFQFQVNLSLLHTLPQIQAVTSGGVGEYSQRITIMINGT